MPAIGQTGYQDWQRTVQVDTPAFLNVQVPQVSIIVSFPATRTFDVSRFNNTGIWSSPINTAGQVITLGWYLDPAGTIRIGQRQFLVPRTDTGSFNASTIIVPNQGPYLIVTMQDVARAANWGCQTIMWATNRSAAGISTPQTPQLIGNGVSRLVTAGGSIDVIIPYMFAGEVTVNVDNIAGGAGGFNLLASTPTNSLYVVASELFTNNFLGIVAAPLLPLTLRIFNKSAADQQVLYGVTPGVGAF